MYAIDIRAFSMTPVKPRHLAVARAEIRCERRLMKDQMFLGITIKAG